MREEGTIDIYVHYQPVQGGFSCDSGSKEFACNTGDPVQFLGQEDPLEKGMATHFSILAWRIPVERGARQATVHGVVKIQT